MMQIIHPAAELKPTAPTGGLSDEVGRCGRVGRAKVVLVPRRQS
jgi:hypothetical protein